MKKQENHNGIEPKDFSPEDISPLSKRKARFKARRIKKTQSVTSSIQRDVHEGDTGTSTWHTTMQQVTRHVPTVAGRLMVCSILALIVAVALIVTMVYYVNITQYRTYAESDVELLSQSISDTLSLAYRNQHAWTPSSIKDSKTLFDHNDTLKLCVTNELGTIIYNDFDSAENPLSIESGPNTIVVRADIVANGRTVGHVILSQEVPLSAPSGVSSIFFGDQAFLFWLALGVSLAFVILLTLLMSRWIAKPIKKITRVIQQLRLGNYKARTGFTGGDELGQLGETLDAMASALERNKDTEHKLTSDIAHELRTPLMAIQVTIEGMQDGVLPADPEHLETIASEIRRLSRLIDAMLTLSRLENNTAVLHKEYLSVGPLTRDIFDIQKPLFQSQGIDLQFVQNASDAQLMAMIDSDLLTRAVLNLLSNALRYTEAQNKVSLVVGRQEEKIYIEVADSGIGISEEDIEHVFSRFWRSDAGRARVSGGLGVGLSLVDEIVSKHGGFVQVESQEGEGSIFTIYLPSA